MDFVVDGVHDQNVRPAVAHLTHTALHWDMTLLSIKNRWAGTPNQPTHTGRGGLDLGTGWEWTKRRQLPSGSVFGGGCSL